MIQTTEARGGRRSTAKETGKHLLRHENAVLVLILIIIQVVLAIVTKGFSASRQNVSNVLLQSSMRGIAGIGQLFVILTGGIDLSVGGIALICANLGGSLLSTDATFQLVGRSFPLGVVLPIMLLVGAGIGSFNGMGVSRLRMPPLIVTLAVWQLVKGGAYQIGGGFTIVRMPRELLFFGAGDVGGVPMPVIVFIVAAVVAYIILYHTTFGRSVYAAGGNPTSAWLSGINVPNIVFIVYMISGFLAAVASIIYTSQTMSASMATAVGLELDTIAAVAVGGVSLAGGKGTLVGVVIGVIIIGSINNGMNVMGLSPSLQDLVKGGIIFAAVAADVWRRRKS